MKKREPAVMTVSLQSLNITYSVIEEFKLFVVLLFNCFFWGVKLHCIMNVKHFMLNVVLATCT